MGDLCPVEQLDVNICLVVLYLGQNFVKDIEVILLNSRCKLPFCLLYMLVAIVA